MDWIRSLTIVVMSNGYSIKVNLISNMNLAFNLSSHLFDLQRILLPFLHRLQNLPVDPILFLQGMFRPIKPNLQIFGGLRNVINNL